jgi:hypothetical protein
MAVARKGGAVQPDASPIIERLSIGEPLIGFYDAPDAGPFEPLVAPKGHECVFKAHKAWLEGKTLHLTKAKHGCGAMHLLNIEERSRGDLVAFLCDEEGLKASRELMNLWLDAAPRYDPRHEHVLIGPLRPGQYEYLRTVTFYVNPDQLSVLSAGAIYYSHPGDPTPVVSRFGSGCMQLAALFDDLEAPQALIGALDHAMRTELGPCTLGFTVTKSMFELLCRWAADPKSSLHTRFLGSLLRARGGSLA